MVGFGQGPGQSLEDRKTVALVSGGDCTADVSSGTISCETVSDSSIHVAASTPLGVRLLTFSLENDFTYDAWVNGVTNTSGAPAFPSLSLAVLARPDAPSNLSAEPGRREVTLNWEPPLGDSGLPVQGYEYRHEVLGQTGAAGQDSWTPVIGGAAARSVKVSDLAAATEYSFYVRAVNEAGPGGDAMMNASPLATVSSEGPNGGERPQPRLLLICPRLRQNSPPLRNRRWVAPQRPNPSQLLSRNAPALLRPRSNRLPPPREPRRPHWPQWWLYRFRHPAQHWL